MSAGLRGLGVNPSGGKQGQMNAGAERVLWQCDASGRQQTGRQEGSLRKV